ncbi:EF-hand domain-containing protein [Paracoccus sp. (in: a-proteobacteria)]|uniref:EF-hand domain-containing protein n=1 Tax=Paracoccus sp. TaxID=267 RepID=UPI0025D4F1BE|nr:EF-hand domain-containing protein [Paracoccus sp. (in: a-proteobacteria)]
MTMNATRIIGFASTGLLAIAGAAFAHEMDTDQDGLYSLSEMQTEYADLTQQDYDALDTSKDGAVDAEELAAAIENGALPSME